MFKLNSKKLFFPIAAIISVVVMVFFISYSLSQESYAVSAFTEAGEHTWIVPEGVNSVDVLVVAGGGGGGSNKTAGTSTAGGGGGAGGLIFQENYSVSPGEIINIVVGDGGQSLSIAGTGNNGENSVFGSVTATGGGGGGYRFGDPASGGSGGGVGYQSTVGGSGLPDQGNNGGSGNASLYGGAGGGGAGSEGIFKSTHHGTNGGDGLYYGDIFGDQYGVNGWFAAGGGGGTRDNYSIGLGGQGGGGNGGMNSDGTAALNGTGSGGGGSGDNGYTGGSGGSGIVLIKYRVKLGTVQAPTIYKGLVGHWSMDSNRYVEGTENLISSSGLDFTVMSTYSYLSRQRVNDIESMSGYACEIEILDASLAISSARIRFGDDINIPTSGSAFISVYAKFEGGPYSNIKPAFYSGSNWYVMTPLDGGSEYLSNYYRRFGAYATLGINSGGPNPGFSMTYNNSLKQTGQKTRWHSPQVELKDHATPFTNGTRAGRLTDSSSYSNHGDTGISQSFTFTEDRFGKEGGAMSFDGNNYIDCKESSVFVMGNNDFTMGAWVYPVTVSSSYNYIISIGNSATGQQAGLGIRSNSGLFLSAYTTPIVNTSYTLPGLNDWYHIMVSYNGNTDTASFFVNGQLVENEIINLNTTVGKCVIGAHTGKTSFFNSGYFDDVRIYNRALSESEIQSLYDSYNPKTTTGTLQQGLVLDMPLKLKYTKDETPGSEIMTDRTPYSNDGQNYGAVLIDDSADFNGSTNYIGDLDTNNPALFEPSSITVSSWINLDTNASTNRHIWFTKWYGYSCEIEATTRLPYFRLNGPGDIRSNTPITPGKWHHFVGTYDPNIGGRVYLDGELVGSRPPNGDINHSRNFPLNIGRYYGGVYFDGKISNALIYNRALSDEEVKTLYDRGRGDTGIVFRPYGSSQDSPGLSCKDILETNPSASGLDGLYWINPSGSDTFQAYCDMTTDGGGWTLALLSNMSQQYCPNVGWENVINDVNYNGSLSSDITTFDLFMGLKYWNLLGTKLRLDMGDGPDSLSHRTYQDFSINAIDNYKISMANQVISIGGTSSGLYAYHNNRGMTTYDSDNDVYGANCSVSYNNAPWWYKSCWSGSLWGGCGTGYKDGPFWTGSSSEYFNYGSIWLR